MPKIRKVTLPYGQAVVDLELHYNQKNLFHFKDLPAQFEYIPGFENRAATEDELVTAAATALRNLAAEKTTQKFVLAVQFIAGSSSARRKDWDPEYETWAVLPDKFTSTFSDRINGYGLALKFRVLCQVTTGTVTKTYGVREMPDGELERASSQVYGIGKEETVLEYSKERHQFFKRMGAAVSKLAWNIAEFLGQPELEKVLDQAVGLPGLPEHAEINQPA